MIWGFLFYYVDGNVYWTCKWCLGQSLIVTLKFKIWDETIGVLVLWVWVSNVTVTIKDICLYELLFKVHFIKENFGDGTQMMEGRLKFISSGLCFIPRYESIEKHLKRYSLAGIWNSDDVILFSNDSESSENGW